MTGARLGSALAAGAMALLLGACGEGEGRSSEEAAAATADEAHCVQPTGYERSLNQGYILLYRTMDGFSSLDMLPWVKDDRDVFGDLLNDVADYAGSLAEELEELDEEDPVIDLTAGDPLPPVIQAARDNLQEKAKDDIGGPFGGLEGRKLERTVLLMLSTALPESQAIVRELARRESDPRRHELLAKANIEIGKRLREVNRMLERDHYQHGELQEAKGD